MSDTVSKKTTTNRSQGKGLKNRKDTKKKTARKYSAAWVVMHGRDAPDYTLQLIEQIRNGVTKSDWKQLINDIGHTEKELESILPSSISSMQKKTVYDKESSERIYELAKLYSLGLEVFDTQQDFKKWLMSPIKTLGGQKPFDLLDSSFGFQVVENEIVRIQYNVYS
jgi:putative toxin-antitoxin system antitoxin component (TIGR02293 family)